MIFGGHNVLLSNRVRQIVVTYDILNNPPKQVDIVRTSYNNELRPLSCSSFLTQASENWALLLWKNLPRS
jgi:hypothetical protein